AHPDPRGGALLAGTDSRRKLRRLGSGPRHRAPSSPIVRIEREAERDPGHLSRDQPLADGPARERRLLGALASGARAGVGLALAADLESHVAADRRRHDVLQAAISPGEEVELGIVKRAIEAELDAARAARPPLEDLGGHPVELDDVAGREA